MSPEAKERIARIVDEVWRAASAPGAAKDHAGKYRMTTYATGMLETAVHGEVERRLALEEARRLDERGAG